MSTTIDQRVVEMRFDNKQFESNVKTSMSTLDKLKKALNLDGAAKGLDSVAASAKKCDMSPLSSAVEGVKLKFSAMEIMAITALQNIANTAINVGKNIVSALTIDPVRTGMQEYETQINAIQTILANTSSKGTTLDQVNEALDELNHYADMTIYNFTEMTRNIGTFTAAGVDLDTSVSAIKGIANLAAVSGSTSQQASTAMYQLSQALAAGTVKLMDWNSVVNAGMGGQVFQDALKETARVHGIAIDDMIEANGSFRESLQTGWLSTEVLTETLSKFTGDLTEEQIKSLGYTDEQTKAILKMGQTANDAATKVKTFTQLVDTLKEAAQSGWTQTWEYILGDFNQAKSMWTKVSDALSDMINNSANERNDIVSRAFRTDDVMFNNMTSTLEAAGISLDTFQEKMIEVAERHGVDLSSMITDENTFSMALSQCFKDGTINTDMLKESIGELVNGITGTTKSTKELGTVVDDVIKGKFGNGQARVKALTEAGYDYATVQNLVNEKLGSSYRHISELAEAQGESVDSLAAMSDEQLKNLGYTEEEIKAIRDLKDMVDGTNASIDEWAAGMQKASGASLLFAGISNIYHSVLNAVNAIKQAWREIFYEGMSDEEIIQAKADRIYSIIERFEEFTEKLQINDDVAGKLVRTFKGLFAIVDIVFYFMGGTARIAIKVLNRVLEAFDLNILDVTANVGDLLVQFRDFIKKSDVINGLIKKIANVIALAIERVRTWIKTVSGMPVVQNVLATLAEKFKMAFSAIQNVLAKFQDKLKYFVSVIKDAFTNSKTFSEAMSKVFETFKSDILGYFNDTVAGTSNFSDKSQTAFGALLSGVKAALTKIAPYVSSFVSYISDTIGVGNIIAIAAGIGIIYFTKQTIKAMKSFKAVIDPFNGAVSALTGHLATLNKKVKSEAVKNIAMSIAILAGAIVALSQTDPAKMWSSVGAITVLMGLVTGLYYVIGKFDFTTADKSQALAAIGVMVGIAISLMLMAATLKNMESLDNKNLLRNVGILVILMGSLTLCVGALSRYAPQLSKGSITLIAMAVAVKLMVDAVVAMDNALAIMTKPLESILGVMALTLTLALAAGVVGALAGTVGIGGALMLLTFAWSLKSFVKALLWIATEVDFSIIKDHLEELITALGSFVIVVGVVSVAGKKAMQGGIGILAMALALSLIISSIKRLAKMDKSDIKKAQSAINGMAPIFIGVIAATKLAGQYAARSGVTLLAMAASVMILALAITLLANIKKTGLKNAMWCIDQLGLIMIAIVGVTHFAKSCMAELVVIAVITGLLAIALAGLSMIAMKDPDALKGAANAITEVLVAVSIMMRSIQHMSVGQEVRKNLIIIAGILLLITGIFLVLTNFGDMNQAIDAASAMSLVLLAVSASMQIISRTKTISKSAKQTLAIMIGMVATIGAILTVMTRWGDMNQAMSAALSLSIVLLVMSVSMKMLGKIRSVSKTTTTALAVMIGMVAAIGAILTVMTRWGDMGTAITAALSLSILLIAVAASLKIIGTVRTVSKSAMVGLVVLTGIVALLAVIISAMAALDFANSFEIAASLSVLLLSLSISLGLIGAFGSMSAWVDAGLVSMLKIVGVFGGLLLGLGALCEYFPGLQDLVDTGIPLLISIGEGLGGFIGSIIGGIFEGAGDGLESFAESMSNFMDEFQPFIESVNGLDSTTISSVDNLCTIISKLTSEGLMTSIKNAVSKLLTGDGSPLKTFGEQLPDFGESIAEFGENVKDIDSTKVTAAANAGKMLGEMAKNIPTTKGALSFLTGEKSMDKFGENIEGFGTHLAVFGENVSGINESEVTAAARAGKALGEMADAIGTNDGWITAITGETNLVKFGAQIASFGGSLSLFDTRVKDLSSENVEKGVAAGNALIEMTDNVGVNDGWITAITGETNLVKFGAQIASFGGSLALFDTRVKDLSSENVKKGAEAGTSLATMADNVGNTDGLLQAITGEANLVKFGAQIASFGGSLALFDTRMANTSDDVEAKATQCASVINTFSEAMVPKSGGKLQDIIGSVDLASFGTQIARFGVGVNGFYYAIYKDDWDLVDRALVSISKIISVANNASSMDISGLNGFSTQLKEIGLTGIDGFAAAFSGADEKINMIIKDFIDSFTAAITSRQATISATFLPMVKSMADGIDGQAYLFNNAGSNLMTKFISGINSKSEAAQSNVKSLVQRMVSTINNYQYLFTTAGMNLMSSLASGINSNASYVMSAMTSVANACINAIYNKSYYDSFVEIGKYFVDGFAEGVELRTWVAKKAAKEMAGDSADAAAKELDEHSPSKVTKKIGRYFSEGFAIGIESKADDAITAAHDLATYAKTGLSSAVATIKDLVENGIDEEPTIRPVMDLSDIEEKTATLGAMLSRNQAVTIGASMYASAREANIQNGESTQPVGGNSYNFTQNNYSPKALSRIDIYRQTKNQFSTIERMAKT